MKPDEQSDWFFWLILAATVILAFGIVIYEIGQRSMLTKCEAGAPGDRIMLECRHE